VLPWLPRFCSSSRCGCSRRTENYPDEAAAPAGGQGTPSPEANVPRKDDLPAAQRANDREDADENERFDQRKPVDRVTAMIERMRGVVRFNDSLPERPAVEVTVLSEDFTDAGYGTVGGFSAAREALLRRDPITDDGLKHVASLPRLKTLGLAGTRITDRG